MINEFIRQQEEHRRIVHSMINFFIMFLCVGLVIVFAIAEIKSFTNHAESRINRHQLDLNGEKLNKMIRLLDERIRILEAKNGQ